MSSSDTAIGERRTVAFGRPHRAVALLAALVSIGAHVGILIFLSGHPMKMQTLLSERDNAQWLDPVRVLEVIREKALGSERWDMPAREAPGPSVNWQQESERLARPPDAAATEAPPAARDVTAGDEARVRSPDAIPERKGWEPRQEVVMIEQKVVRDEVSRLPRRVIPRVERVRDAPDVVAPIDRTRLLKGSSRGTGEGALGGMPGRANIAGGAPGRVPVLQPAIAPAREEPETPMARVLDARPAETRNIKPIEKFLKARVQTWSSFWESKHAYFKLEIERAGDEVLPAIPKDILLVQDSSASMTEQKLHFCRDGLTNCLTRIGPRDRFNVVSFKDRADWCFPDWKENRPESIATAMQFVGAMRSTGNTDIFGAAKELLGLQRKTGRPVVVLLVTDGRSTTGLTGSSDIIGEFSRLNDGAVSVYTMGTIQSANVYLLDLLSYCNRGESVVVTRGRWDIPATLTRLMDGVARPVLADVSFTFADRAQFQVYPEQTSNLYLDRPLTLYGRYFKGTERMAFQAVGRAGDVKCDMIFDLDLGRDAVSGEEDIRQRWAEQRIYYLIGQYTRSRDPAILNEMKETARSYKIEIPYEGKF